MPVEVVTLDRESFLAMLADSDSARADVANLARQRAAGLLGAGTQTPEE